MTESSSSVTVSAANDQLAEQMRLAADKVRSIEAENQQDRLKYLRRLPRRWRGTILERYGPAISTRV